MSWSVQRENQQFSPKTIPKLRRESLVEEKAYASKNHSLLSNARYEVAIISPDNDAYNGWLVGRKNVVVQFESINPVIDPGSPVRLLTSWSLWDPEYDISSSSLNPLELISWHQLTRRRTVGGGREEGRGLHRILAAAAFPASTPVCPISQSGPVASQPPT